MLIFTQDRNNIINFNVTPFLALHPTQNKIYWGFTVDEGILIGEYETKERASDVLQEIWEHCVKGTPYIMPLK